MNLLAGRYRLIRPLGQGGMGKVFMASDLHLHNRPCVVKKVREDFGAELGMQDARKYFEREATTLSRLHHPNVVQVTDFFEEREEYYLVMEYVEGKDLKQLVQDRQRPFESKQVIDWAIQICGVLEYLHQRTPPIVYRDLKPSNLMVDVNGVLKLVDFGIARQYAENGEKAFGQSTVSEGSEVRQKSTVGQDPRSSFSLTSLPGFTDEGTSVVSAGYSSPEQYRGDADPRSDIYALGATMHFLLTGVEPIPLAASTPRSANAGVDEPLNRIVETATLQDPDLRFQTAYAMRQALLTAAQPHAVPVVASWKQFVINALIFAATLVCVGYLAVRQLHGLHQSPPNITRTNVKVPQFHNP